MTDDLAALYDEFTDTAFRLERWQHYAISAEDPAFRAFREDRPRPERSVRTSPWLARIAVGVAARKDWSRVRVIEWPLSEYTRYELVAYVESQAAGERIQVVDRADVGDLGPDFWLFDAGTDHAAAVVMHYGADGELLRREPVRDLARVAELDAIRVKAQAAARPLNEFLAAATVGRCRARGVSGARTAPH